MKVAIRADGGPDIGYGHLLRSGVLATQCLEEGDEVFYFTRTPATVSDEFDSEIDVVAIDPETDLQSTVENIQAHGIDVIFTDSFVVDTEYQTELMKTQASVVVRHNYRHEAVSCDLLVFGNLYAPDLEYDWHGPEPTFLLGPQYILLRDEFRAAAKQRSVWNKQPKRALIVMGGSDVNNTTPSVMECFAGFDGVVDVVVGPGYSNKGEIEQTARAVPVDFELHNDPKSMADLMSRADLAVSAVGGTIYELIAMRTPFIGVPQVENQTRRADVLREREYGIIADGERDLSQPLNKMIDEQSFRRQQFDAMAGVIDGRGVERIYAEIESLTHP